VPGTTQIGRLGQRRSEIMHTHTPTAALAAFLTAFASAAAAAPHDGGHVVRGSEPRQVPPDAYGSAADELQFHAPTRYDLYDFQLHGR
jgi:hypothetical protein